MESNIGSTGVVIGWGRVETEPARFKDVLKSLLSPFIGQATTIKDVKVKKEQHLSDWVLKSIAREQENERKGSVSPVFSSVAEMKKWHE
jgi:hypothetical protein